MDLAARDNPAEYFGRDRESCPIYWDSGFSGWVITDYESVAASLRDPRFSAKRLPRLPDGATDAERVLHLIERWIVFMDPPDHTRLRKLVAKAFTPSAVQELVPYMEAASDELVAALPVDAPVDVISSFAFPFPAQVIAKMLSVPESDVNRFSSWSDHVAELIHAGSESPDAIIDGFLSLEAYLRKHIETQRPHPSNQILGALIFAEEGGETLSLDELVATAILLLFAGHETTKNLIGNSIVTLWRETSSWDLLTTDPTYIPTAVEELLRFEGPAKATIRLAKSDVEVGGQTVRAGDKVLLVLASANRDPQRFAMPELFDIARKPNQHLAFGQGIHYCLGAALVRSEMAAAIQALRNRFSSWEIVRPFVWQGRMVNRGIDELWVRFQT